MDNPVGAERPAQHHKKTSCVSTGRLVPVLCTRQVAHHNSFLSRQRDVIAPFSLSKPIRSLVTDSGAGWEGLVCPLGTVLTYKNLIYLLNLQFHCVNTSYPMDNS